MSVTEEEAKTKWCPFARVRRHGIAGSAAFNRFVDSEAECDTAAGSNCVGSDCMAWRISQQEPEVYYTLRGVEVGIGEVVSWEDQNLLKRCERKRAPVGFCGLAGAPQ